MPDKHRGAVDFYYNDGAFSSLFTSEPLQLYRVFEREVASAAPLSVAIPEHTSLLLFCLTGEGSVRVDDAEYPFTQESVLFCPTSFSTVTLFSSCQSTQFMCVLFSTSSVNADMDILSLVRFFQATDSVRYAKKAAECHRLFTGFLSEISLFSPTMMLVKGCFYQMLVAAYRCLSDNGCDDIACSSSVNAVGQTVYAIIRYIDSHLFTLNNLTDMAKELGYSYNYLSHLFRRKTGMTIQAYVTQKKIERSTALLEDEQYSVTEIAAMLNYDCIQSFSKAFRRAMKMSPTEYRAKHLHVL